MPGTEPSPAEPRPPGGRLIPVALALGCFVLMLLQSPGTEVTDTKIDLGVDPGRFLGQVTHTWTSTGSLGHIWGSQYVGYLFPMGPFFAGGDWLGLPGWVVERLWMGSVLALAAWGVVRLLDAMLTPRRGVAHVVAGVLFAVNPYVIVVGQWRSVQLLAFAALPWLLLATHRGLRDPRGWWWPAAFALVVQATGAGINAALTGFVLLGPVVLALYEPLVGHVPWRAVRALALRVALLTAVTSLWWLVPVLIQVGYGHDFQQFTEGIGTIWGSTSVTEALRLMGFWTSYVPADELPGTRPYLSDMSPLLFSPAVLAASLIVPGLCLAGFTWTRQWRYGPFFLALVFVSVLVVYTGFPDGTLLREGLTFVHNHFPATRILRTTYKVAPLAALGLACLGGVAASVAWDRLSARSPRVRGAVAVAVVALLAVAAWPMTTGRSAEKLFRHDPVPAAWTQAARDLDRSLPANARGVVLPGQLFGFYDWGGTFDPILPTLAKRPVAGRYLIPWAELGATDLLWTTDGLVQDERVRSGQVPRLLSLMGAGAVVAGTDDDRPLTGALPPAAAAEQLRRAGLGAPAAEYGARRRFTAPDPTAAPEALPRVRRYTTTGAGLVRVRPRGPLNVVDGSAAGLAGLAALGPLPGPAPLAYAGDRSPGRLRADARAGASFVVTDSNRRRVAAAARLQANSGWTLPAREGFSEDAAVLDPFDRRPDAQTVAVFGGIAKLSSLFSPQVNQFPERRPFAAFDGDPDTAWLGDRNLDRRQHWIEVTFKRSRDIDWVDLLPYGDSRGRPARVSVGGRTFTMRPGWNRLPVRLRGVRSLRVEIRRATIPAAQRSSGAPGGFREIRIPGVHVTEALRPPVRTERALAGTDLSRNRFGYLFERTTAPDPFRPRKRVGELQYERLRDSRDAETGLRRSISPPAARRYRARASVTVAPTSADDRLDRLAGYRGEARLTSSSRFQGRPGHRASRAFGGRGRGWIGEWVGRRGAWIAWRTPSPATVRRLTLAAPPAGIRRPARVRLRADGRSSPSLTVGRDGRVELPRALRARAFRLDVLKATGGRRGVRAVGIGRITGAGVPSVRVPRAGRLDTGCGQSTAVVRSRAGVRRLGLRARGSVAAMDAGRPLAARGCGTLAIPAGPARLTAPARAFAVDLLNLESPARAPVPVRPGGGAVLDPGSDGDGHRDGARVRVDGPSWLILGESYNRGWRATCDGRDLGAPSAVDGFANGWRIGRGCRDVDFTFAPSRTATWAGIASGVACLVLLAFVVLRRRRAVPARAPEPAWAFRDDLPRRLSGRAAVLAGLVATAVLSLMFAIRAGVVLGPAVGLVLWRGIGPRALALAAGALLTVAVPLVYVLHMPSDRGGFNSSYATKIIAGHWIGVAAVVLLGLSLAMTLAGQRMAHR